jgi:predicted SprT family Zn-dependent metalloprotease
METLTIKDRLELYAMREILRRGLYNWYFEWSHTTHSGGDCTFGRKRIRLSTNYLHLTEKRLQDVILHEIAHAMLPPKEGHSERFRQTCISIGCKNIKLDTPIVYKYEARCPEGDFVTWKQRKFHNAMCPKCHSILKWTEVNKLID